MAIQIQGNGGTVAEVDGTTFRALRVAIRPADYGSLGSYAMSGVTGTLAASMGANADIMQWRWTHATNLGVIRRIRASAAMNVAASAATLLSLEAVIARSWTVDGSGGTTFTITGNNGKLRASMGTTLLGAMRMSTTAGIGIGTRTLDTQGIGIVAYSALTGAITVSVSGTLLPITDLFDCDNGDGHPVVLTQNEGVVVKTGVAHPAGMTWNAGITVRWAELASY
jgi:hypothetical protein